MTIKFSDITGGGIPYGDTAGRPANPGVGKLYSNGELQRIELYTGATYGWQNIVAETPGVTGYTGAVLETNTTNTITITGTNFASGATAALVGQDGTEHIASSTTVNNLTSITAVFGVIPQNNEPYDIRVTNPSNLYGVYYDILTVNDKPLWTTAAGSLGTFEGSSLISITLSATDEENNTLTYSLASGSSLPSGLTLNSSTGVISGILPALNSNTTYSFTINVSDGVNASIPRTFSIDVTPTTFSIEYLVVAGGGGGGGAVRGGGGGAGGYRSNVTGELSGRNSSPEASYVLNRGEQVLVTVGNGGASGPYNTTNGAAAGQPGENSVFGSITSLGGGNGGASDSTGTGRNPGNGGSGGGGFYGWSGQAVMAGTAGQGFQAGASSTAYSYGGGGGGAGGPGYSAAPSGTANGSKGGPGLPSSITGTETYYAGGGSSAGYPGQGTTENVPGGIGGGGTGMNNIDKTSGTGAANGTANTGGGGGASGNGGSGVVIIAYPDTKPALTNIPGTLTYDEPTRSGYRVYRFTAGSGTITF